MRVFSLCPCIRIDGQAIPRYDFATRWTGECQNSRLPQYMPALMRLNFQSPAAATEDINRRLDMNPNLREFAADGATDPTTDLGAHRTETRGDKFANFCFGFDSGSRVSSARTIPRHIIREHGVTQGFIEVIRGY
ncbi:hypothetical protein PUNSTDRAFT_122634 [Punctularia strigosozonata HHB-11173 SS5]|uniref:Uncharacterized protein n=1 Tax=Punctularia strigosozonata (strain HHB-11173) TaxID=741275 RepID=R7S525_PUNST|nr:uncharacterized protein PUNSTDRAFT_122634 [Punctularia strigosozonata HHB-11173 SS5]EIN04947.1 hypothetical protein PUNSTDRAFT_122634 [Punctularia strigosozonata HHB-11173 SS5]